GRRYTALLDQPQAFAAEALRGESLPHLNPAVLLAALFNWVGGPVELDDLVNVLAQLLNVRETREQETAAEAEEQPHERVAHPRADVAAQVDQRVYLEQLWSEIRQLPPRQCAALLLNLKDANGKGVIALLPLVRIAPIRQL